MITSSYLYYFLKNECITSHVTNSNVADAFEFMNMHDVNFKNSTANINSLKLKFLILLILEILMKRISRL